MKTYTEEYGVYQGVSRIVVSKFKVYYERHNEDIIILALFSLLTNPVLCTVIC